MSSYDVIQSIIAELQTVFAPMDVEVLASHQKWAQGRVQALREFRESDEYQQCRNNAWVLYPRMFAICGGKGWFNTFNNNSAEAIAAFVEKNCASICAKRNATIAKKLEKAGVTEVTSKEFTRTDDGFNGVFFVNTNAGKKRVEIQTIRAGGYNIQCLHLRVLTHIKDAK